MNVPWVPGGRAAGRPSLSFPLWVVSSCLTVMSPLEAMLDLETLETRAVA